MVMHMPACTSSFVGLHAHPICIPRLQKVGAWTSLRWWQVVNVFVFAVNQAVIGVDIRIDTGHQSRSLRNAIPTLPLPRFRPLLGSFCERGAPSQHARAWSTYLRNSKHKWAPQQDSNSGPEHTNMPLSFYFTQKATVWVGFDRVSA